MPLMIKLNRNIMKVYLCLDNGHFITVDKLADFIKHHPEMNLHLHYGNTAELLKLLDQGKIHMAIVEGNYPKEKYSHKK